MAGLLPLSRTVLIPSRARSAIRGSVPEDLRLSVRKPAVRQGCLTICPAVRLTGLWSVNMELLATRRSETVNHESPYSPYRHTLLSSTPNQGAEHAATPAGNFRYCHLLVLDSGWSQLGGALSPLVDGTDRDSADRQPLLCPFHHRARCHASAAVPEYSSGMTSGRTFSFLPPSERLPASTTATILRTTCTSRHHKILTGTNMPVSTKPNARSCWLSCLVRSASGRPQKRCL